MHAFLAGGAIVSRDVPPYVMVEGNPAVPHSINAEGLKRRGFSEEQIRNVRDAYRVLYRSDLKLTEALARLEPLRRAARRDPRVRRLHPRLHAQPGAMNGAGAALQPARALRVGIVAGEHSGDTLGAALIEALRERVPQLELLRRRGAEDDRRGLRVAGRPPRSSRSWGSRRCSRTCRGCCDCGAHLRARFRAARPDVFVGIDAPEFNLRLARAAEGRPAYRTVQYVSPQVWAWRQGRVRTIGAACDLVLCLLPFETEFYAAHGVRAEFVGHPLADEIPLAARSRRRARARSACPPRAR